MIAKTISIMTLCVVMLAMAALALGEEEEATGAAGDVSETAPVAEQSDQTGECVMCHESSTPGIVAQWLGSTHFNNSVGCFECHQAQADDVDALDHYGHTISVIVSPTDCQRCHPDEVAEFTASHHARAGQILDSLDNRLAEIVEGDLSFNGESPVAVMGCAYCHGSNVQANEDGTLTSNSYPNSGVGRINPDGSWGACSACHMRHNFEPSMARRPDNCGRCHLGPDHPQLEVYTESQHGIAFANAEDEMALDGDSWVVGVDYTAAPTCATCHMGATRTQEGTHDVGTRLSWNLRAPTSALRDGHEASREAMSELCGSCHSEPHISAYWEQLDAGVALYNNKFALPATEIYNAVRSAGFVSAPTFDDEIEWAYWYLWHHEGRRARTGMAMLGPDYVQWHGFYDIAERFYFELVPQAREICEENLSDHPTEAQACLDLIEAILARPEHLWFSGGTAE